MSTSEEFFHALAPSVIGAHDACQGSFEHRVFWIIDTVSYHDVRDGQAMLTCSNCGQQVWAAKAWINDKLDRTTRHDQF